MGSKSACASFRRPFSVCHVESQQRAADQKTLGPKNFGGGGKMGNPVQCHFQTGRCRSGCEWHRKALWFRFHFGLHLGRWTHQRRPFGAGESQGGAFHWQCHKCCQALHWWLEPGEICQDFRLGPDRPSGLLPATPVLPQARLCHMGQFDRCGAAVL